MACIIVGVAKRIKYKLNLPDTTEAILMLEQVGRKVAMVIYQDCFGLPLGLAVDTHLRKCLPVLGGPRDGVMLKRWPRKWRVGCPPSIIEL